MTVKIQGLDELMQTINTLNQREILDPAMAKSLVHLQKIFRKQPRKARGAFSAMATPGQKRAFWAKVRSGEASVNGQGYVRTRRLRDGWTTHKRRNGTQGEIKNMVPYGTFVQGIGQQSFHNASKWQTVQKVAEEEADNILKFFEDEYAKYLEKNT